MANIKIPTYERQVDGPQQKASQAQAPAPLRQAYGEDVAQATGNFGKAMQQLGQDFLKIDAKNTKDRIMLATNRFALEYKKFQADLKNRDDYQNFSADADKFLDTQFSAMQKDFGDDLFGKWWQLEGQLLSDTVKAETDIMKVPASLKQENKTIKDNISTQAYNYATTPDTNPNKPLILQSVLDQIDSSAQPADFKLGMKRDAQSEFAKADIEYRIYDTPEKVKKDILSGKYKIKEENAEGKEETISFITPQEEARYLKRCDTLIKQHEGTRFDEQLSPVYEEFNDLYAVSPSLANQYYLDLTNNRTKLREKGVPDKKMNTVLNYMKSVVNNPNGEFAINSIYLKDQNTEEGKDLLREDKDLAKEGKFLGIENFVNYINKTNALIDSKDLREIDKQVLLKNREKVLTRLGDNIRQEKYSPTTDTESDVWDINLTDGNPRLFSATNNGYLKERLKDAFVKSGMLEEEEFKNISVQDVGAIYANAFQYCGNMNMSDIANTDTQLKIQEAVSKAIRNWVAVSKGKKAEQAQDILIKDNLLVLADNVKQQSQGISLNSYKE